MCEQKSANGGGIFHGFETEAASLTAPSLPAMADCTVKTDMLGDDGPSPPFPLEATAGWWLPAVGVLFIKGFRE